jgi:uncharacterized NAD(P)/FAD-binding protein YdhS
MAIRDKSKPLYIAIIGSGISGVIPVVALLKYLHISFTINESLGNFGEIGAGIAFAKNSHLSMRLISPTVLSDSSSKL